MMSNNGLLPTNCTTVRRAINFLPAPGAARGTSKPHRRTPNHLRCPIIDVWGVLLSWERKRAIIPRCAVASDRATASRSAGPQS